MFEDFLDIVASFGIPAIIFYVWLRARHRERMTIIERGLDPAVYLNTATPRRVPSEYRSLRWALILVFVGAGVWFANWLVQVYRFPHATEVAIPLIGGGLALLIAYIVERRARKSNGAGAETDVDKHSDG